MCALVVASTAGAAAAAGAGDAQLCPVATKRLNRSVAYQRSDNVIKAPATADETAALLTTVQSGAGDARMFAIIRLALAGDLDAFRYLLGTDDVDGVFIYANSYLNADDTMCIDPELEAALLERMGDEKLDRSLVALLGKNTYRSERVLQALREVAIAPEKTNRYFAFGQAITATQIA